MKNKFVFLSVVFSTLLFASCTTVKSVNNLAKVFVTNTKQINLLPPEAIETTIDDMMQLTGDFGDVSFSLITLVQADETGLYFSLLNDFGTDMGTITYDGIDAISDSPVLPEKLKVEYILNDFQNAFYNPEKMKQNLNNSKLDFSVTKEADKEIRRVLNNGKIVEEVTITAEGALINNLLRGYSFSLYFFQ